MRPTGASALVYLLLGVAIFGSLHLAAASHPNNIASKSWLALGF